MLGLDDLELLHPAAQHGHVHDPFGLSSLEAQEELQFLGGQGAGTGEGVRDGVGDEVEMELLEAESAQAERTAEVGPETGFLGERWVAEVVVVDLGWQNVFLVADLAEEWGNPGVVLDEDLACGVVVAKVEDVILVEDLSGFIADTLVGRDNSWVQAVGVVDPGGEQVAAATDSVPRSGWE